MRPNILLITADDMNYNSVGAMGCTAPDITPNIDGLAKEGMLFKNAHVCVAVCQPSRQTMMTGCYPHNIGAPGFDPIGEDVTTLQEVLKDNGYYLGIIGKLDHLAPMHKYCWDYAKRMNIAESSYGRDPELFYSCAKEYIEQSKKADKPFFLMANSADPHRPFVGSEQELNSFGYNTKVERTISEDEIEVPGFLPDIKDVRKEVAQYFTSVHRCDQTVGAILKALEESGLEEDTLVMFLSDNGMAFPFAKTNCYLSSTKTPLIAKWPNHIAKNIKEEKHMVCGVDYTPTILDILGIEHDLKLDGSSFAPLLSGEAMDDRDFVYTIFNANYAHMEFPMRCVQNAQYGYIFNAWSDDETVFFNESKSGLTYNAMVEAAKGDSIIADRVKLFDYRVTEEFYDMKNDPNCLNNLIDNPEYKEQIDVFKDKMYGYMDRSNDPLMKEFKDIVG